MATNHPHPLIAAVEAAEVVMASPLYVQTVGPFRWPTAELDFRRMRVLDDEYVVYEDEDGKEWELVV